MKIILEFNSKQELRDFIDGYYQSGELYSPPIETAGMPVRVCNALIKGGYETISEVAHAHDKDLERVKGLGKKSVRLYVRPYIRKV